ncbi:hypothetical protein AMS68_002629 [Peltaster fructicola]|uniref:JmjC domain-containing protein n=1 Tax=Peltaster fructicola TaxID=286661 RepID=A0A6H0XQR2_9PEZI|nr:hypothetical protein AMS68_002629 [Peltaster fructicola]
MSPSNSLARSAANDELYFRAILRSQPHFAAIATSMTSNKRKRSLPRDAADATQYRTLATLIYEVLGTSSTDDSLSSCGSAALYLVSRDPDAVLELAHEKLHAWPYRDVPLCWRRMYEEASLYKAAMLLRDTETSEGRLFTRLANPDSSNAIIIDQLSNVVAALDMGIALSGQPRRRELFGTVMETLSRWAADTEDCYLRFNITMPAALHCAQPAARLAAPEIDEFQRYIDTCNKPLVITDLLDDWPALELWQDPNYLLKMTIGGRRLVPVEIGQSYTDNDWTQRIMPFKEYLETFVLPNKPEQIGYLAQHDLLGQVPALLNDIRTPDYCYTEPPPAPATLPQRPAQLDQPQLNAWFGPKGTRSPLHTDPYYNILCQVVGYKYVRLYAPEESSKLYARGTDESGVSMANTSQINLSFMHRDVMIDDFPELPKAQYQEIILHPGESLYIPAGWWHFVESLSTSFSVSFWWN